MSIGFFGAGRGERHNLWRSGGLFVVLASLSVTAFADDAQLCSANAGTLIVGTVVSAPTFKHGMYRKGVELSHTHLTLKGESDGANYDVAMDNVFATGYQPNTPAVPAPLNTIAVGDKLELCGLPFPGGIHWVHTNCGDTATTQDPNGWVKEIAADGTVGPNLEDGQKYCSLWPHR